MMMQILNQTVSASSEIFIIFGRSYSHSSLTRYAEAYLLAARLIGSISEHTQLTLDI